MNVYPGLQTSGNNWTTPAPSMSYQGFQESSAIPEPRRQVSIFEEFEKQMAASAAEHEAELGQVSKYFVLPADSSVTTFLNEYRALSQVLLGSVTHIKAAFGVDAIVKLRAPLDESGSRTLYAVVIWPGNIEAVRRSLSKFDEEWWIAHSPQASGHLEFTYELV